MHLCVHGRRDVGQPWLAFATTLHIPQMPVYIHIQETNTNRNVCYLLVRLACVKRKKHESALLLKTNYLFLETTMSAPPTQIKFLSLSLVHALVYFFKSEQVHGLEPGSRNYRTILFVDNED